MARVLLGGVKLIDPVVQDLATPGMTPVLALERALEDLLHQAFSNAFDGVLIKPPKVKFHSMYFKQRYASLPALLKSGYETWYPEITLATKPEDSFDEVDLASSSLELIPITYGWGVTRIHRVKVKALKKQVNHVVRINHIRVGGDVIGKILEQLSEIVLPQPLIANFDPEAGAWWHRFVSFDHMLSGKRFLCECSRNFHSQAESSLDPIEHSRKTLNDHVAGSEYQAGLCHLCIARHSPEDERYGASVETCFEGYIDQVMFDLKVDKRTAKAEIQHVLGLSRWQRESALYGHVRDLFPDCQVLREASPEWLGRMRIDIYVPELCLAVEHHGEQHYRPVAVFGGEEAHRRAVERDELKRKLCAENGVEVVDFRFDAELTKASVKHRLRRFLELANGV